MAVAELMDIGPRYSDEERAHSLWCQRVQRRDPDLGFTTEQADDLVAMIHECPISTWQFFKAGWDAAKQAARNL